MGVNASRRYMRCQDLDETETLVRFGTVMRPRSWDRDHISDHYILLKSCWNHFYVRLGNLASIYYSWYVRIVKCW